MAKYTLIESRDPWDSADSQNFLNLALSLKKNGDTVTLFLVQNAVLAARKSAKSAQLTAIASEGVEILADTFSLRERGVEEGRLASGIKPAEIGVVVDHMVEGRKTIFH
jgi:sulfur relay (sulfurtransferase) complex TusBCD TusD component (DsrE family)